MLKYIIYVNKINSPLRAPGEAKESRCEYSLSTQDRALYVSPSPTPLYSFTTLPQPIVLTYQDLDLSLINET